MIKSALDKYYDWIHDELYNLIHFVVEPSILSNNDRIDSEVTVDENTDWEKC